MWKIGDVLQCTTQENISFVTIEVNGVEITCINHQMRAGLLLHWYATKLQWFTWETNSHHGSWGYSESDANGEVIAAWAQDSDLELLYCAKDRGTSILPAGRINTPDLSFVTRFNCENWKHGHPHSTTKYPKQPVSTSGHTVWTANPASKNNPTPKMEFPEGRLGSFQTGFGQCCPTHTELYSILWSIRWRSSGGS